MTWVAREGAGMPHACGPVGNGRTPSCRKGLGEGGGPPFSLAQGGAPWGHRGVLLNLPEAGICKAI